MYKVLSLCFTALMLVTLSVRPATSLPQGYLKGAILIDIKRLLDILPKDEGELYTPDNTDVKCAREAMICYMTEIGALAQESEDRIIIRTIERIQRNIGAALEDIASKTNVCPLCESHELQKTIIFLEHMIQFVQLALNDNSLKTQG